ncbi:calcium-binding protein [Vreelandella titanicae]|uniref:calcium-binding protein n=1 Tax=Vreelandella titanicae TaxID=664683 RepID=UPI003D08D20E
MAKGIKHLFQIHHILPNQLFKNERIKPELKKLFGDDYLNLRDSIENKTALYRDAAQAETIKQSLLSGDNFYRDIGIGGSYHEGGHPGYNQFLIESANDIFSAESGLSADQQRNAFFDLTRFATQISEGTVTFNGESVSLAGGDANFDILTEAWAEKHLDYTAPDVLTQDGLGDFIEHFNKADITDKGTDGQVNTEHRLIVTEKQTKAFYESGVISEENYHAHLNELADIRKSMESSSPAKGKGGDISNIFYKNSYDKAKADGQPLSAEETVKRESGINNDGQPLAQTLHKESGPTQVSMEAAPGLAVELEQRHLQLPEALTALDQEIRLNLEKSLVGVGGGIIGDAGEFLNHSYDSLKHGLDTGDWQPMRQDVETFGAAIVLSAFVVVGTTVLAGVAGGPGAAAWVANGWAIYGIVDGLNNISELIGKVIDDVSYWVDMLSDGFMSWLKGEFGYASKVVSPLVLDLDGDGVETIALTDGAYFDHDGNGFAEKSGWVSPDDGLLVWDKNGDGNISDGSELFGNHSLGKDGEKAEHGFASLAVLDTNDDGVVDAQDADFASLQVWQDKNGDGRVQAGELRSLADAGVASLSIAFDSASETDEAGNLHLQLGHFTRTDGSEAALTDVWFQHDLMDTRDGTPPPNDDAVSVGPGLVGYGNVHDLHTAVALDESGRLGELIEQFGAEQDIARRHALIDELLFAWTGANAHAPDSRGQYIEDARKLYAVEAFMGEKFVQGSGTNAGLNDPGPNAARSLTETYQALAGQVYASLAIESHHAEWFGEVGIDTNGSTWHFETQALVDRFSEAFQNDGWSGIARILEFADTLKRADVPLTDALLQQLNAQGAVDGSDFERLLAGLGQVNRFEDAHGNAVSVNGAFKLVGFDGQNDQLQGSVGDDELFGLSGDDTLTGGAGKDRLDGGDGADTLKGGDGDDRLDGGAGDDELYGDAGEDRLDGGDGADTLEGGDGDDRLDGGAGDDELYGDAGADTLEGGDGADTLKGGDGDDLLNGGVGDDELYGDAGADTLKGGDGADELYGGEGDDELIGQGGDDRLFGGRGRDELIGGEGADELSGGDGNDLLKGNDGNDTLTGGMGGDILKGGAGDDELFGGVGNDYLIVDSGFNVLDGGAGDDEIRGGSDGDDLKGGSGDDFLFGGGGFNSLDGGTGNDSLYGGDEGNDIAGGSGNDFITGGAGDDFISGDGGDDIILGKGGKDTYRFSAGWGKDEIIGATESDIIEFDDSVLPGDVQVGRAESNLILSSRSGDDRIEVGLYFSSGPMPGPLDRVVFANGEEWDQRKISSKLTATTNGNDIVEGTDLDELINGQGGNDILRGGKGDDTLIGGAGHDILEGGEGSDEYWFAKNWGVDTIDNFAFDHSDSSDVIVFLEGIAPDDISVSRDDFALVLESSHDGDRIIVNDYFLEDENNFNRLETIRFFDGTEWSSEYVKTRVIQGTDGDDHLRGYASDDELNGGLGNDILNGGAGNDTLYGGAGDDEIIGGKGVDTVLYGIGDGNDTVNTVSLYNAARVDVVEFREILPSDVSVSRDKYDLIVTLNDSGETLTVTDFLSNNYPSEVETLRFANGVEWTLSDIESMVPEYSPPGGGSGGINTEQGTDGDDRLVGGIDIDFIYGKAGNDILEGKEGPDILDGGMGDDVLIGGRGDDSLIDPGGSDTFVFSAGDGLAMIQHTTENPESDHDVLIIDGIDYTALNVSYNYVGLLIEVEGSDDVIMVASWQTDETSRMDIIQVGDHQLTKEALEPLEMDDAPRALGINEMDELILI